MILCESYAFSGALIFILCYVKWPGMGVYLKAVDRLSHIRAFMVRCGPQPMGVYLKARHITSPPAPSP